MGNPQATDAEIGWLAGVIDGEGHIGLSAQNSKKVRSVRPDLQIVNCDHEMISKAVRILRQLGVNPYIRERTHSKKTWSTNWIVTVGKFAHMKRILDVVKDHLTGMKRERAELVLALIESRLRKTRFDQYDEAELAIVEQFKARFIGKSGASTTAREARGENRVKIQSELMGDHERKVEAPSRQP